jgi:hypothetical protein
MWPNESQVLNVKHRRRALLNRGFRGGEVGRFGWYPGRLTLPDPRWNGGPSILQDTT